MEFLIRDWAARVNLGDQVVLYGCEKKDVREELAAMVAVRDLLFENRKGEDATREDIPILGEDDEG